jgi:hypothetical protein
MADIANYFSNSKEFLKKFGDNIVNAAKESNIPEKINQGLQTATDTANKVGERLDRKLYQSRFGTQMYGSKKGPDYKKYQAEQRQEKFNRVRFSDEPLKEAGRVARESIPTGEKILSDALGNTVFTKQAQLNFNKYTTPPRMASDVGVAASKYTGLESPVAMAAVAAGVPLLYATLSGQLGSPLDGFRPKGYKAVAPKSKDEDPTGRTPRDIVEEGALRTFAFQRSQMLPFKEFIKERPDVMPSTIADYRRYVNRKPEAGKRIDIDPEKQTFTAFGGLVKGTARGLNDPEIRLKGMPITASSVLGIGAGIATIKAAKDKLDPRGLGISNMQPVMASDITPDTSQGTGMQTHAEVSERFRRAGQKMPQGPLQNIPENRREQGAERVSGYIPKVGTKGMVDDDGSPMYFAPRPGEDTKIRMPNVKLQDKLKDLRTERRDIDRGLEFVKQDGDQINISGLSGLGDSRSGGQYLQDKKVEVQKEIDATVDATKQYATRNLGKAGAKFQDVFARRPDLKEPAIILGGTLAALGTAAVAKKLFQKAEQERIKKEDPLQYKKYKRGDYTRE